MIVYIYYELRGAPSFSTAYSEFLEPSENHDKNQDSFSRRTPPASKSVPFVCTVTRRVQLSFAAIASREANVAVCTVNHSSLAPHDDQQTKYGM